MRHDLIVPVEKPGAFFSGQLNGEIFVSGLIYNKLSCPMGAMIREYRGIFSANYRDSLSSIHINDCYTLSIGPEAIADAITMEIIVIGRDSSPINSAIFSFVSNSALSQPFRVEGMPWESHKAR